MSLPRLLKFISLPILATVCVLVALSACGGVSAAPANVSRRVSGQASVDGGEPTCKKPDAQSIEVSSNSAGAEGELGIGGEFLTLIGEGAFHFTEDKGLGWLLSLVTGQQQELDPAHVDEQFDQVNRKLDALAQQQFDDCEALAAAIQQAKVNDDLNHYANLSSQVDDQLADLRTYQNDFTDILDELQRNGGDVGALNSGYEDDMRAMIAGTDKGLPNIIDNLDTKMAENKPSALAMVSEYTKILTEQFPYNPYNTHIFTPAFLNAGAAMEGYYAAAIDEAVYLYSNVAHLDFTASGGYTHKNDPSAVVRLVNRARKYIQGWSSLFADGPDGGTWVSQGHGAGLGTIPAGTVLDYRSQNKPLLWTTAPVGVNGESSDPVPYYCPSTAQFCYADQYNGAGKVADTRLVRPSPEPLAKIVDGEDIGGVTGWRVPTSGDWTSLIHDATGGLTAWASANQLGKMFATQPLVSHYGGKDQTLTTIAPILVDTGTTGNPSYSVLSSTDPSANTLTLEKPDVADAAQNDVAGRLFLTRDYQPTTPPQDLSTTSAFTSPSGLTSTGTAEAGGAVTTAQSGPAKAAHPTTTTTRGGAHGRQGSSAGRAVKVADVPAATTFANAVACSSASSYKVPVGVGAVKITAVGGAGADGTQDNNPTAPGGVGGSVTETVPVTAGDTLYVQVGGVGAGHDDRRGGVGGGGSGGLSHSGVADAGDYSGGGGGASGVATTPNCSHWLIVAGGGGGGGAGFKKLDGNPRGDWSGGRGGDGCAGRSGCTAPADGKAYSQPTAGHAGGTAPDNQGGAVGLSGGPDATAGGDGSLGTGGDGGASVQCCEGVGGGGGGGGGYYGGGGGGGAGNQAGGGGGAGGASFAIPGATDVSYGLGRAGKAGSVTITPIAKQPVPISLSVSPDHVAWDQPMPVTFTAKVPADATGTVTFSNDDGVYGTAPIRNGVATLPELKIAQPVGTDSMRAWFQGDSHYLAADSNWVTWQVTKNIPFMQLTVNGTELQSPKSLVVQVPPQTTGSVGFYNDINGGCEGDSGPNAKCQGLGVAPIVNGYAILTQLSTPLQPYPATNYIHASYGGDSEYGANSRFAANDSNVVKVTPSGS